MPAAFHLTAATALVVLGVILLAVGILQSWPLMTAAAALTVLAFAYLLVARRLARR